MIALSCSIGAHWAVLQSAAWVGMAVTYSQGSTLKEGLAKTFDGKHPCCLCKFVAEGKKSERKPDAQFKISKLDLFPTAEVKPAFIPATSVELISRDSASSARAATPPTPPPRPA